MAKAKKESKGSRGYVQKSSSEEISKQTIDYKAFSNIVNVIRKRNLPIIE
jgi:hypothetical protein